MFQRSIDTSDVKSFTKKDSKNFYSQKFHIVYFFCNLSYVKRLFSFCKFDRNLLKTSDLLGNGRNKYHSDTKDLITKRDLSPS